MHLRRRVFVAGVLLTFASAFAGHAVPLRVLVSSEAQMLELAQSQVFESLVTIDQDGTLTPCLADSWEADVALTEWTFHIRPGVVFHDGQPLVAQHVVDSLAAALAPEGEIVALSSQTLVFHSHEPAPLLLRELTALPVFRIASAAWASAEVTAIGTGPYTLTRREGAECVLEPFSYSWRALTGATFYDRIDVLVVDSAAVRRLMVQDGSADVALDLPISELGAVDESCCRAVSSVAGPTALALQFNLHSPQFSERAVRDAVTAVINQQYIIDEFYRGWALPCIGPVFPSLRGAQVAEPRYSDIEAAATTLGQAGWTETDGRWVRSGTALHASLLMDVTSADAWVVGLYVKDALEQFGIGVDILDAMPSPEVLAQCDMVLSEFASSPIHCDLSPWIEGSATNRFGYSNPLFEAAATEASHAVDPASRMALLQEAEDVLECDAAVCWLVYPASLVVGGSAVQLSAGGGGFTVWSLSGETALFSWSWPSSRYWRCIGECIARLALTQGLLRVCVTLCDTCIAVPTLWNCAPCIACLGGTAGFCAVECRREW